MKNTQEILGVLKDCDKLNRLLNSETDDLQDVVEEVRSNLSEMAEKGKIFHTEVDEDVESELLELESSIKNNNNLSNNNDMKSIRMGDVVNDKKTVFASEFPCVSDRKEPSLNEIINDFRK